MSESRSDRGATILVVEDEAVNRKLVLAGLRSLGPRAILEAADGLAAKEILAREPVDLVITDLMMPRLDGLALMRWAQMERPGPVWIILSGLDTFDAAVEAIHLGAFDFLAKPIHVERIEVAARNALRHRRLETEREELDRRLKRRVGQLERLCHILEDQAEVILRDLRRAEIIQRALLPRSPPAIAGYSVRSFYRPGSSVGGDLYDVAVLDDRHVAAYVADATGHGVSAAMLSVLFKQRLNMLDERTRAPLPPAAVLEATNRALLEDVSAPGMFITAAYCLLDVSTGIVRIAAAGHPPAQCLRAGGGSTPIERTGPALALYPGATFREERITLGPGDRLFLYTDGLLEGAAGGPLPLDPILGALGGPEAPGTHVLEQLYRLTPANGGDRDDVTMLLLQAGNAPSDFDNEEPAQAPAGCGARSAGAGPLLHGESDDWTFIGIHGRGTWQESDLFHEAARTVLEAARPLTIDLSSSKYLDSTFLGTIHEVVGLGDARGVRVRIQGVDREVRRLFEQLSMDVVLEHIDQEVLPFPPHLNPLRVQRAVAGGRHQQMRVLRAHEALSSLSEENRAEFEDVVHSLREELGG
jgi:serine phosphatase RsbU (regulator of sigma subunit)/anti-anti-sigma regulatory factor